MIPITKFLKIGNRKYKGWKRKRYGKNHIIFHGKNMMIEFLFDNIFIYMNTKDLIYHLKINLKKL